MPIIQCDIREGWTDEQKADLSKRISEAVHKANTDAPPEHIHAAVAACRTYGRYPAPDNLDDIPFEPPERESFEEFLEKKGKR